jgi:hypothetical protein
MTNPTIKIHNAETGEVLEREMNAEELAVYQAAIAIPVPTKEELEKATAKAALLEKLGITADEAELLLG